MNQRQYAAYVAKILILPIVTLALAIVFLLVNQPLSTIIAVIGIALIVLQVILAFRRQRRRNEPPK